MTVLFYVLLALAFVCQVQVYRAAFGFVVSHVDRWFVAAIILAFLLLIVGLQT